MKEVYWLERVGQRGGDLVVKASSAANHHAGHHTSMLFVEQMMCDALDDVRGIVLRFVLSQSADTCLRHAAFFVILLSRCANFFEQNLLQIRHFEQTRFATIDNRHRHKLFFFLCNLQCTQLIQMELFVAQVVAATNRTIRNEAVEKVL